MTGIATHCVCPVYLSLLMALADFFRFVYVSWSQFIVSFVLVDEIV